MSFFTAIFLALRWAWVPCSLQLPQLALVLCTQSSVPPACCPRQICLEFLWLLCCLCSVCCGGGWCPTVAFACAPACWVGSHQAHVPMVEGVTPFYLSKRFLVPVILRTSPRAVLLACDLNSPVGYSFLWAECSAVRSVLCWLEDYREVLMKPDNVYAVHPLGRIRLFLVMPHNLSTTNPRAVSFLYLWVVARDLRHQFLLCFVCNYWRRALIAALAVSGFLLVFSKRKSLVFVVGTISRSGLIQSWGGQVASKEGNVSFPVLMVNTLALEHICLQITLTVIKDACSWKWFLKVQRNGGGRCVKEHLVGLISY